MTRAQFVEEVRSCIGTPFQHCGRVKGLGMDCAGLIVCSANTLGVAMPMYASYSRQVDTDVLQSILAKHTHAVEELNHGTVLLLRVKHQPRHLAVYDAERNTIVHAFELPGKVVENTFQRPWSNNIHSMHEVDFE